VAEYTLPELDWDYGALEPHISGEINELHHSKHHAAYVAGANAAVAKLAEARANDDHSAIFLNEKNLGFHLGGHVNHSIWWKNLSPNGGDKPTGEPYLNSPNPDGPVDHDVPVLVVERADKSLAAFGLFPLDAWLPAASPGFCEPRSTWLEGLTRNSCCTRIVS
jgi:hypothetical protein